MKKHTIYVRLIDGRVGILTAINSAEKQGKYAVYVSGEPDVQYFPEIKQRITETEYADYKPTKQPAKRGSKKP